MVHGMGADRTVRFIHTADLQLGMTRHFLEGEAQARFTQARIDVIGRIGAVAGERDCAFVVVAGDVFDSNFVDRQVLLRSLQAMGATGVPFYLLPGNHDTIGAGSVYRDPQFLAACPPTVRVLTDAEPVDAGDGVQVVGAPWSTKRPGADLVTAAVADLPADGTIRVAVGHGAVRGVAYDGEALSLIEPDGLRPHLDRGAVHYVALGDRHSTTCVDGLDGRVWYSGAPEPTSHTEVDPGNVLVVEAGPESCSVESVRVGEWSFHSFEPLPLDGAEDVDLLERRLAELERPSCSIVRIAPVGSVNLRDHARYEQVVEHASTLLASLQEWGRRSDLVVVPDVADMEDLGLSGPAAATLDELRELAASGTSGAEVAADALGLLHRLVRGVQ